MAESQIHIPSETIHARTVDISTFQLEFPADPMLINDEAYGFVADTEQIGKVISYAASIGHRKHSLRRATIDYELTSTQLAAERPATDVHGLRGELWFTIPRAITNKTAANKEIAYLAEASINEQFLRALIVHKRLGSNVLKRYATLAAGSFAGFVGGEEVSQLAFHYNPYWQFAAGLAIGGSGALGGFVASALAMTRGGKLEAVNTFTNEAQQLSKKVAETGPSGNSSAEMTLKAYFEKPLILVERISQ